MESIENLLTDLGEAFSTPNEKEQAVNDKIADAKEFHAKRLGNITASIAHRAFNDQSEMSMSDKQFSFMCELVSIWRLKDIGSLDGLTDRLANVPNGKAAQLGLDSEARIDELLSKMLNKKVSSMQCTTLHPTIKNLGATPDGKDIEGQFYQYKTAVDPANFIKFRFVHKLSDLRIMNPIYYYQGLCEMSVTRCEVYNFVYYCPYSDECILRAFTRDEYLEDIQIFEAKIEAFLNTCLVLNNCNTKDEVSKTLQTQYSEAANSFCPHEIGEIIQHDGENYEVKELGFNTVKASKELKKGGFSKTLTTITI